MKQDLDRILISKESIAERVAQIAATMTQDLYAQFTGPDAPMPTVDQLSHNNRHPQVTLVPILTGSLIFVADLIRHLPLYLQIRLMGVSSYPGTATATRGASVKKQLTDLPESLAGHHVLLIDDILDSGGTLKLAVELLKERQPASVQTCVLLRKQRPEAMAFPVDYVCFDIPDEFVVGYGLDFDDYYRNLPDIHTLRPEVARAH